MSHGLPYISKSAPGGYECGSVADFPRPCSPDETFNSFISVYWYPGDHVDGRGCVVRLSFAARVKALEVVHASGLAQTPFSRTSLYPSRQALVQ